MNQALIINKTITKEMKLLCLINKFLNAESDVDRKVYNKQRKRFFSDKVER